MILASLIILLGLTFHTGTTAFDYDIVGAESLIVTDVATAISPLETLFVNEEVGVTADGLTWAANDSNATTGALRCETFLNGELVASGDLSLDDVGRELPSSIGCGTLTVAKGGRYTIEVVLTVGASETSTSGEYEAYAAGVAILPLVVILFLAITTNMVRNLRLLHLLFLHRFEFC